MGMPSGSELLLIFGIVILLFGAKKIPDLAKGLGQGIRNFKKEMKDDKIEEAETTIVEAPKQVQTPTATTVEATTSETTKQA
jgi:sec-independent protein translocase protein TatA